MPATELVPLCTSTPSVSNLFTAPAGPEPALGMWRQAAPPLVLPDPPISRARKLLKVDPLPVTDTVPLEPATLATPAELQNACAPFETVKDPVPALPMTRFVTARRELASVTVNVPCD